MQATEEPQVVANLSISSRCTVQLGKAKATVDFLWPIHLSKIPLSTQTVDFLDASALMVPFHKALLGRGSPWVFRYSDQLTSPSLLSWGGFTGATNVWWGRAWKSKMPLQILGSWRSAKMLKYHKISAMLLTHFERIKCRQRWNCLKPSGSGVGQSRARRFWGLTYHLPNSKSYTCWMFHSVFQIQLDEEYVNKTLPLELEVPHFGLL